MGVQEQLREFMDLMLQHSDKIDKMDIFIKMKNGNKMTYKMDRKLEEKLAEKEKRRIEKIEKIEVERKKKEELKKGKIEKK